MDDFAKRSAFDGAIRFLVRRGYDVVSADEGCGMIAFLHDEVLAFAKVFARRSGEADFEQGFCEVALREEFERYAIRWMQENEVYNRPVRFDSILMTVWGERAFLKHHVRCLG